MSQLDIIMAIVKAESHWRSCKRKDLAASMIYHIRNLLHPLLISTLNVSFLSQAIIIAFVFWRKLIQTHTHRKQHCPRRTFHYRRQRKPSERLQKNMSTSDEVFYRDLESHDYKVVWAGISLRRSWFTKVSIYKKKHNEEKWRTP